MTRTEMQSEMQTVEMDLRVSTAAWYAHTVGALSTAIRSKRGEDTAWADNRRLDAISTALRARLAELRSAIDAMPQTVEEHDDEMDRRCRVSAASILSQSPVQYRSLDGDDDLSIARYAH